MHKISLVLIAVTDFALKPLNDVGTRFTLMLAENCLPMYATLWKIGRLSVTYTTLQVEPRNQTAR